MGVTAISINHLVVSGLASSGLPMAQQVAAFTSFHHVGGPVVALFMLPPLTYLLATLAAWRAGFVPRAALILWLLFTVTTVVGGSATVAWASILLGLALTGWIARGLVASPSRGDT
jgi:hypothetical protein